MKNRNRNYLKIGKELSEAHGKLEVIGLLILKGLNSRSVWVVILLSAMATGIISSDELVWIASIVNSMFAD